MEPRINPDERRSKDEVLFQSVSIPVPATADLRHSWFVPLCLRASVIQFSLAFAAIAAILLAASALADRPLLPPPISSPELAAYTERLQLSEAQSQAWHRSSLDYQNEYRERRTALLEEIAPLREELGDVPISLTTGRAADRFFTRHRAAMQELAALDQDIISSIAPLLSDEQRESLPEVIETRRLSTLTESEIIRRWFERYRLIDWRSIVNELTLEYDMRERVEPLLRDAERTVLSYLEDLHRQTAQMSIDWARRMDRTEHDPDDPEGIPLGVRFEIFVEVAEPARTTWAGLINHQREMTMRIMRSLPAEESWSFYRTVFEYVPRGRIGWHLERIDHIIERARRSDLPSETINQFISNVRLAAIDFANELITAHDEWGLMRPPPLAARGFDVRVMNYDFAGPRGRIDATITRLVAVFDDETAAELERIWNPRPGEPPPRLAEIMQRHKEERAADLAPDPFLPGPLPRETLRVFADVLDLTPEQRAEVERLHQEYERVFMRIRRNEVDRVLSIFVGFRMSEDHEGMMQYSAPEEVEAKHEARKDARATIDAIDRTLEQNIASLLTEERRDSLILLRLARAGQTDARGLHPRYHAGEYVAHRACLFRAIDDAKIDGGSRDTAMNVLAEHAEALLALLPRLYESELEVEYRSNRALSLMRLRDEDLSAQLSREREQAIEALRSTRLAVVRETRAALDSILAALPEADAEHVYDSYLQLAFPSVFVDDHAQHERFRAALAARNAPGLDAARRERLAEKWAEYQWQYRELSRRMAETMAEATHAGLATDEAASQQVERISRAVEAIRLERDAANDAARVALREVGVE